MFERQLECCQGLVRNALSRTEQRFSEWQSCEIIARPGTFCLPIPQDEFPDVQAPTSCCEDEWNRYVEEKGIRERYNSAKQSTRVYRYPKERLIVFRNHSTSLYLLGVSKNKAL